MKTKVSAMMITRNRKDLLREAIKGVLSQTYKNFELIIIDNASTDGTEEVVKEFNDKRIIYIRNKENFYPGAVSQAVDLAKGEYIAICDDDDISLPVRFEKSVEFLEKNLDVGMIGGGVIFIDKEGNEINRFMYPKEPTFENIYISDGMISSPTVMMRKDIIKKAGGYDNNLFLANDYDLYLRIAKEHKIRNLDWFLSKYRIGDNISLKDKELTAKYRQRALLKWAKVSCLCFSYNRVFQLENYIRSFLRFVVGVQLNVRYQYSEDKYKKGYEELIKKYPEVNFIEGDGLKDFQEQVLGWLKNAPSFVMFGCDDVIYKDYVDMNEVIEKVKLEDTIGFSLRLGKGLTYHFPADKFIKEPKYEDKNGILKWKWKGAEGDYGYPFELDASVYKKEFVKNIINYLNDYKWSHPNLLEGISANLVMDYLNTPKYLYAFSKPKSLVIQINRVQDLSPNRFYDIGYDINTLQGLWEKGKKLDLDYYKKEFNSIYIKDFVLEEEKEKVSVIIPVYNQKPEYFKEAVESVINQTIKPHEIIIIDDGSEPPMSYAFPDTRGIEFKNIRNEKNMGIGYSRQKGVDEATGDYIAFLSSDDIWDKNFLKIMTETAKQNSGEILFCSNYNIDAEGNILIRANPPNYGYEDFCIASWEAARKNRMFVNFSSVFIPKQVFEKVKFDKNLRFCEDLDFLLRSMKHFKYFLVNQPLLKYRAVGNLTGRILSKIPKQNEGIRKKCMEYWHSQQVSGRLGVEKSPGLACNSADIIIANWNRIEESLGGQETFFKELSKTLNAKIISYLTAENVIRRNLSSDPFYIVYRGYITDEYLKKYEDLFPLDLIIRNSGVGGFIKLKTPQLVIFQDPYYSILQTMLKKGLFLSRNEHYLACIEMMRRTAKQGKTVAVSNFMKEDMKLCGIKCDKIIEEGIDIEKFNSVENKEELKRMHNLPIDKKIGIAVTKFTTTKGWDILAKLINKFQDIYWIVVLTSKVGSKPKLKNVTVIEQVNPEIMPRFYNCADFFINTSPIESFGLSACEAASCNLPIIIYRTGIFWDWWDKRLGIRVEDWTYEGFEKAVEKIRDSDLKEFSPRKAIIERGFTKERMSKDWKDYVENLLKK